MKTRSYLLATLAALVLPLVATAETINIGFAMSGATSTFGGVYWNNIPTGGPLKTLVNSTGESSGVSVEMTDGNPQWTYFGSNPFPSLGLPDASLVRNAIYGHHGNRDKAEFTFTGLDQNYTYTFRIYATIDSAHAAEGKTLGTRTGSYTATGANSESGVVDASDNTTEILTLSNIRPDANGSITLLATTDNATNSSSDFWNNTGLYYLNALTIESTFAPIPEPATYAALLGLGAIGLAAIRRKRTT